MKKTIKLAVVAALALGTTSAFATNGSNLIGLGAKARGMGGVSIATNHGAENGLSNAALITDVKGTEISFGGTFFMPDVKNDNSVNLDYTAMAGPNYGDDTSSATSQADLSVIPEVSIASKVTDNFYMGVGMWGTAGMGVDYRDDANTGQMNMVTNLQLMQFGVPLAYKINNFSVAITPVLQYGSLDVNYVMSKDLQDAKNHSAPGTAQAPYNVGMGVAQDLEFGYNIGLSYEISGFIVGAIYKSQIDMEYKGFSKTVAVMAPGYTNDKLSTPAEMGIGVSYEFAGNTIGLDYKNIAWSSAKGYEDFEWDDQDVIALGYEYATSDWAVRVGYNYASSPISEKTVAFDNTGTETNVNSAGLSAGVVNTFNLLGFPGIVESHYSLGCSYNFTKTVSADLAYTYAAEVTETYKNFLGQDITTTHSQAGLSAQVSFLF
jgi:long-chain fatty acid transport protein